MVPLMSTTRPGRAGAMAIRVWTEPGVSGFRARLLARADVESDVETIVTVDDRDELLAAVGQWLDEVLSAPAGSA
jgi:hypothetical protein